MRHFISQDTNQGVNFRNLQTLPSIIPTIQLTQNRQKSICVYSHLSESKGHINLKICCINPRSLKNKTLYFCNYIISNDFDHVAVTETWLSLLDYCNALLSGVLKKILNKLHNFQNTDARAVTKTSCYCNITPILKEFHWVPVQNRIQYKILTHTYKALHEQSQSTLKSYSRCNCIGHVET